MKFKTKIIEIFGLPKTGKSTIINAVKKHLKNSGYKVDVIKERASICPIKDKLDPNFNYWTSVSLMKEYIEANDRDLDFIIADRGIFDALVWVNYLSEKQGGNNSVNEFFTLINQEFILKNYLFTFYFYAEIDTILDREFERQVERKFGVIMNPDSLKDYRKSYYEVKSKLEKWSTIFELDTSELAIKETISIVSKELNRVITTANNV